MLALFSKSKVRGRRTLQQTAPKDRPNGFTLIEVLATVALLAFGLSAILSLQASTMKGSSRASGNNMATFLAESQLEYLRTMNPNRLLTVSPDPEKLTYSGLPCEGADAAGPCFFTRTTTVIAEHPVANSFVVSVNVSWADIANNDSNRNLTFDTVIADTTFN